MAGEQRYDKLKELAGIEVKKCGGYGATHDYRHLRTEFFGNQKRDIYHCRYCLAYVAVGILPVLSTETGEEVR